MNSAVNIQQIFLLFILYSFLGWICEVLYVGIFFEHKFINRGFLHSPICPIYGFGGLIVLHLLQPWNNSWIQLFLASAILCSLLEYISSYILEVMFQTKWCDYSDKAFNLHGRICLLNSTLFGLMGVLTAHFVQPLLSFIVFSLSDRAAAVTATAILAILIPDLLNTIRRLVKFNTTMAKLQTIQEEAEKRLAAEIQARRQIFQLKIQSIKEKAESDQHKFTDAVLAKLAEHRMNRRNAESLLKRFPSMTSRSYSLPLDIIRQKLRQDIEQRRAEFRRRRAIKK